MSKPIRNIIRITHMVLFFKTLQMTFQSTFDRKQIPLGFSLRHWRTAMNLASSGVTTLPSRPLVKNSFRSQSQTSEALRNLFEIGEKSSKRLFINLEGCALCGGPHSGGEGCVMVAVMCLLSCPAGCAGFRMFSFLCSLLKCVEARWLLDVSCHSLFCVAGYF